MLMSFVGELGSGKTLSMTYLLLRNWQKGRVIYANYTLYGIPFYKIRTLGDFNEISHGMVGGDELWLNISSWAGRSKVHEFTTTILLRSRKKDLHILYTTQNFHQVNKRVRDVTDYIVYSMLSPDDSYCRIMIFRNPPSPSTHIKPDIRYHTEPVFAAYNTNEIVEPFEPKDEITLQECYYPIQQNPAFLSYLQKRGYTPRAAAEKIRKIEKIINPFGIKSYSDEKWEKIKEA